MRPGRDVTLLLLVGVAAILGCRPSPKSAEASPPSEPLPEATLEVAAEPAPPPVVGRKARGRAAHHTAVLTARLVAGGTSQAEAEAVAVRLLEPTGCGQRTRFLIVPQGFGDQQAIEDRIVIESSYYGAEITEVADSDIPANTAFAPQFSRIISAVFLFDCPAARA